MLGRGGRGGRGGSAGESGCQFAELGPACRYRDRGGHDPPAARRHRLRRPGLVFRPLPGGQIVTAAGCQRPVTVIVRVSVGVGSHCSDCHSLTEWEAVPLPVGVMVHRGPAAALWLAQRSEVPSHFQVQLEVE